MPRPRLRRVVSVVLMAGVMAWVVLLGTWIAFGRPTSWKNWLSEFHTQGKGSVGARVGTGRRAEGPAELGYLGDGLAELGDYSVTIFDPVTRTRLRTDFQLVGHTACADEKSFRAFMKNNHRFFREQVMVTLRNCDASDLVTSDLRLLEKNVASRVNRALGRRFLRSVDIKNFELYESFDKSGFVRVKLPKKKFAR